MNRRRFLGSLIALSSLGAGALAARASPLVVASGRKLVKRDLKPGEMLEAAPPPPLPTGAVPDPQDSLAAASDRQLCRMVVCASPGMSSDPADHNMHWHGPLSGYVKIGHEFATHYENSGVLHMFGLEEVPPIDASNRCFILGAAAHMAIKPIGESYWESYKGHDYYTVNAQAIERVRLLHADSPIDCRSYRMDSFEGNRAVERMVLFWRIAAIAHSGQDVVQRVSGSAEYIVMADDLKAVARHHPEVYRADVRENIIHCAIASLDLPDHEKTLRLSMYYKALRSLSKVPGYEDTLPQPIGNIAF